MIKASTSCKYLMDVCNKRFIAKLNVNLEQQTYIIYQHDKIFNEPNSKTNCKQVIMTLTIISEVIDDRTNDYK